MIRIINNRTFILVLAFFAGLALSDIARHISFLTLPALAVVLTVSVTQVPVNDFWPLRTVLRPITVALLLNFFLLGTLILILAWWLMPTHDLWVGYVLVAAAPPGIAIIPFTHILNGKIKISIVGTFGVYLLSLFLTPTIIYIFTGEASVSPVNLFYTMTLLIIVPIIAAQLIRRVKYKLYIDKWRGMIINWGFFVVIFSVVGVNRDVFLKDYHVLIPVSLVAIISSFGLAAVVETLGKKFGIAARERHSYLLFSTIKTSAFAAAVGLALYNEAVSVPGAVISAWYALYFIFLGIKGEKIKKASP